MSVSSPKAFPEVRVVEASAGSGKTFALAKRYVQLLLNPALPQEQVPIRNILAMTFTNKAAFEMKVRILEFLKKIALKRLSQTETEEILAPIGVDTEEASQKAFSIMEAIIRNYNFFQVQTIDSFINALLSGCAFKIGLSANFKIKTNYEEYLEHGLDELIDRAMHDKQTFKVFEHFLNQYLFIENRSGWFPKKDMLELMAALYQKNNTYGLKFKRYEIASDKLILKKRKILELVQKLNDQLPEGTDNKFVTTLGAFLEKHDHGFDIDSVSDYFTREVFPAKKGVEVPRSIDKLWDTIREHLRELCEWEAYSIFNCYIDVFDKVIDNFYMLAAQDDILFLEELNKRAKALFDDGTVTVEELYYRLATRFRHYLIDEFQDTNRLQWQNLILMVEEALSTGGSLFYVGDKKQAIYGFRGGEAKLFEELKQRFSSFNVSLETLNRNYRSQKAIVEFNNKVFAFENLKRFIHEVEVKKKDDLVFSPEDRQAIENIFHAAQQNYQPKRTGGFVNVEYIDSDKKDERDEVTRQKLFQLLEQLKAKYSYRDIAILTRGNREVEQITAWLLEEGIFVESERTTNIKENTVIQELIAFLKFLNSPIDNLSFAQFILGDIFSKATGLPSPELNEFIFSLRERRTKEKDLYVYKAFRDSYPQVWEEFIDEFFKNVGLYPLYELMVSMLSRFQCLSNFPEYQGYIMRFLELIKDQEEDHSDLASFLDYIEKEEGQDLYVNVAASDAIRILTIHKAKGLEFPVVIIPFLEMDVQVGAGGKDGQQSYVLEFKEESIELVRLKKKYRGFSPKLDELWQREYIKAFMSELNNIYVALTRAKEELYVFVPKKTGNTFNLTNLLIPQEVLQMGNLNEGTQEHKNTARLPDGQGAQEAFPLPLSQYQDWISLLRDEFQDADKVKNREEIQKGEVVHAILSFIGNVKGQEIEDLLTQALKQTKLLFPQLEDWNEYEKSVKRVLTNKELCRFFDIKKGDVLQEVDVVNSQGHGKRIDRLIVNKDEVWIIDYKSTQDETSRYRQQVQEYKEIMKAIYPKQKISGFLIYLDSLNFEEVV